MFRIRAIQRAYPITAASRSRRGGRVVPKAVAVRQPQYRLRIRDRISSEASLARPISVRTGVSFRSGDGLFAVAPPFEREPEPLLERGDRLVPEQRTGP